MSREEASFYNFEDWFDGTISNSWICSDSESKLFGVDPPSRFWRGTWFLKVFGHTWGTGLASCVLRCGGSVSLCESVLVYSWRHTSWSLYAIEFYYESQDHLWGLWVMASLPLSAPKTFIQQHWEWGSSAKGDSLACYSKGSDTALVPGTWCSMPVILDLHISSAKWASYMLACLIF